MHSIKLEAFCIFGPTVLVAYYIYAFYKVRGTAEACSPGRKVRRCPGAERGEIDIGGVDRPPHIPEVLFLWVTRFLSDSARGVPLATAWSTFNHCSVTHFSRPLRTATVSLLASRALLVESLSRRRRRRRVCSRSCCAGEDSGRPALGRQAHHGEPTLEAGQEAPSAHRRPATADVN